MSKTIKTVKASVGSYTDREGKTKHRYRNIGSVVQTRTGEMLVLDLLPFNWDGKAFLNEPDNQETRQAGQQPQGFADDDNDIPY